MNAKFTIILSVLILSVAAAFAAPGTPNQFYGNVLVNGLAAPDNTLVTARINGQDVSATTTSGGTYGLKPGPLFYVQDPDSNRKDKIVQFYVLDELAGQTVFQNGASTRVNLAVTVETTTTTPPSPGSTGGGGSSGGGGGSSLLLDEEEPAADTTAGETTVADNSQGCTPDWICSEWLDCINGQQKRVCVDANKCDSDNVQKQDIQVCATLATPDDKIEELMAPPSWLSRITGAVVGGGSAAWFGLGIIIVVIGALFAGYFFAKAKKSTKKK